MLSEAHSYEISSRLYIEVALQKRVAQDLETCGVAEAPESSFGRAVWLNDVTQRDQVESDRLHHLDAQGIRSRTAITGRVAVEGERGEVPFVHLLRQELTSRLDAFGDGRRLEAKEPPSPVRLDEREGTKCLACLYGPSAMREREATEAQRHLEIVRSHRRTIPRVALLGERRRACQSYRPRTSDSARECHLGKHSGQRWSKSNRSARPAKTTVMHRLASTIWMIM